MSVEISVVVPVYKVEKYLDACVDSLINQNFDASYEIVLVDDGSPDNCPQMCDDFAKKYKNVISLHKHNGGLGDARNYGVEHANGKYIAFVDSDDYVENTYLTNLWNLHVRFDADICVTRIKREELGQKKKPSTQPALQDYCLNTKEALFEIYKHEGLGWSACGKLFKKELIARHPFPVGYYEDCAMMYRVIADSSKVAIGDYLYNYHYLNHEGSILQSRLSEKHFRIFDICNEFESFINTYYPEFYILPILLKRSSVTQMLNCQRMGWKMYKTIFKKYRKEFRRYWLEYMCDRRFSKTSKMYYTLHCMSPVVCLIYKKIMK